MRMLNSSTPSHVTTAVTVLAANAQALGALTIVRALANCKGTLVSNELYAKVCLTVPALLCSISNETVVTAPATQPH
jgi:hypothetical protein